MYDSCISFNSNVSFLARYLKILVHILKEGKKRKIKLLYYYPVALPM